jgi:hypothetical protein
MEPPIFVGGDGADIFTLTIKWFHSNLRASRASMAMKNVTACAGWQLAVQCSIVALRERRRPKDRHQTARTAQATVVQLFGCQRAS